MSETMLGNNNESEKNKGPEEAPSLSPELEAAMNKVERLENECKEYREVLSAIIESDIKAYGGEENISPRISDYHNQSAAYLEGLENQLASAKDEVSLLEKENNEESVKDEVVEVEESENTEGKILESVAAAENDPSKKEKIPRWKKIGGAIVGAAILGGTIFGGVALNNQLNSDEGPQSGDAGVSSEASSEYFSDVMEVGSASGHEQEINIESVGDYEVANYNFFDENKETEWALGAPMDVLNEDGTINHEKLMTWANDTGKNDPGMTAMMQLDIFNDRDLSGHEALKDSYNNNPELWQNDHEKLIDFWQKADTEKIELSGTSYDSVYAVLGADGTPELRLSHIEAGSGTAIRAEAALLSDGSIMRIAEANEKGLDYKLIDITIRIDCGGQSIDLDRTITGLPNLDLESVPDVVIDIPETNTGDPDPGDPDPGNPDPGDPDPGNPDPGNPDPETEKSKSENPDDYKGGGNPVLEIQTPAEKEPPAVENPAPPSGEIPIIQAPDVELGGDDDFVINIEDIPEEVINGGEAEAPVVDGETEEGI